MIDKDRLIKALEYCDENYSCIGCPYSGLDSEKEIVKCKANHDAVILLREQENIADLRAVLDAVLVKVGNDLLAELKKKPEIIRCKDCRYWKPGTYGDHCGINGGVFGKDEFCSNAKKMGQPRKGHWIDEYPKYNRTIDYSAKDCSVCGRTFYIKDDSVVDFCPHCGADMRSEADGERKED